MSARRSIERIFCASALLGLSACTRETHRDAMTPPPPPPADDDAGPTTDAGPSVSGDAGADSGELWCEIWGVCTGADADGDGYDDRVDCDDMNADVHPGVPDEGPWGAPTCCDGIDNNCNGEIDGGEKGIGDGCCNLWAPCMEEV